MNPEIVIRIGLNGVSVESGPGEGQRLSLGRYDAVNGQAPVPLDREAHAQHAAMDAGGPAWPEGATRGSRTAAPQGSPPGPEDGTGSVNQSKPVAAPSSVPLELAAGMPAAEPPRPS